MEFEQNIHIFIEENINKCIKEELSINNEVIQSTNSIINTIKDKIKEGLNIPFKEGVYINEFSFKEPFLKRYILVSIKHYNFFNKFYYNQNKDTMDFSSTSICDGMGVNFLNINCYSISGTLNVEDLSDSIQHEVSHIFQGNKGSKSITKYNVLYNKILENLNNKDDIIKDIAYSLYMSFDFEQDGYINGLYAQLIQMSPIPNWSVIKNESIAYKKLKKSIELVQNILIPSYNNHNKELDNKIKQYFGINLGEAINFIEKGNKRFLNKIGKVLIKVRKDLIKENKTPIKSIYDPFPYIISFEK